MKYIDRTLATPAENLARDEALLDLLEASPGHDLLVFWESSRPFVVVGYSNKTAREVNLLACLQRQVPVLRRCTGGGTVVQGPGCLNYSLLLQMDRWPGTHSISATNRFVLQQHSNALAPLVQGPVEVRGHSDLTWRGLKISGNAQRRKRRHLLFHGTFLLHYDLRMIEELLPLPSLQPDYRNNRPHHQFITNLPLPSDAIKSALRKTWNSTDPLDLNSETNRAALVSLSPQRGEGLGVRGEPPQNPTPSSFQPNKSLGASLTERIHHLVATQYSRDEWNLKF